MGYQLFSPEEFKMIGEYANIVNKFGIASLEAREFIDEHKDCKNFMETVPIIHDLRKRNDLPCPTNLDNKLLLLFAAIALVVMVVCLISILF